MECLDDNAASEFASGALAQSAVTRVEAHLAGCRDCRALVAALAGDEADSNLVTHKHEKVSEDSQVTKRPVLSIGDRVGRYLVLSSIGAGGMGVVFAAYDPQLDRKVALKLLRANLGANAKEARTRLKREAQAIAQLNHPNVVGVYDVGTTDDGDVYIAMEFVEGDTLTTWLKRWPRTWREILDVFHQAARGLMAAHSVGLLHRDFKPDNVLVGGDGRVRVTDFGLARSLFLDDSNRGAIAAQSGGAPRASPSQQTPAAGSPLQVDLTATGTVLGTPRYMPPEQLTGPSIDARADQFSFCVALYEALYGTHPLPGATSVSMLEHDERALPPPEGTKVPTLIARAVMRGLEKERSKRFPTLAALMHELTPPQQRSPVRFIALAALGALLVTGATAAVMRRPEPIKQVNGDDTPTMITLRRKVDELENEIQKLKIQLEKKQMDLQEIEQVRNELVTKNEELKQAYQELLEEKIKRAKPAIKAVHLVQSPQITESLSQVQRDIEGCFDEWAERAHLEQPRGAGLPISRDADLVVRLAVTPDGVGHDAMAKGHDSPSVRLCIEHAMTRVVYPKGTENLQIQVAIAWSGGNVNMTGHVVGRSEASAGTLLDL